ncbi:hypothetical protein DFH27DRAFT_101680 [Peziza echinospora]|nr:hypothetical protein DFH27DRAFT_101680 [Peziza echinospora]
MSSPPRSRSRSFLEYDEYSDHRPSQSTTPTLTPVPPPPQPPHQPHDEAKAILEEQSKALQSGLIALLDRVDKVKEEHDKLETENQFLQEYIGSLMATSKITGSAPPGGVGSGSNRASMRAGGKK